VCITCYRAIINTAVWSTSQRHSVSCVPTTSTETAHSSRRITRSIRLAFARQLQPHLVHPHLVLVLQNIQRPDHIPSEAVPLVCFDMVYKRAWTRLQPSQSFRTSHNLEQYIPSHPRISRIAVDPCSHYPYCLCATPLFGTVPSGRMLGDERVTQVLHVSYFYRQLFQACLGSVLFYCKFMESYFSLTLAFRGPIWAMTRMVI
jgi:hypothetical protein